MLVDHLKLKRMIPSLICLATLGRTTFFVMSLPVCWKSLMSEPAGRRVDSDFTKMIALLKIESLDSATPN